MQDSLRTLLHNLGSSYIVQQFAPILVLLLVPAIVLLLITACAHRNRLSWLPTMVLENLGMLFSWNWVHENGSSSSGGDRKKVKKKKHVRSRAEQVAQNGSAVHAGMKLYSLDSVAAEIGISSGNGRDQDEEGHYPGLVNISGTYCFMNSVLQVCHNGTR